MNQLDSPQWAALSRSEAAPGASPTLQAHDHAALVYWSQDEFLATMVPFIVDGLRAGDLVVHVAHDEPLPPLVAALEEAGIHVDAMVAAGKLVLMTAGQAFAPNGRFDLEEATAGLKAMITSAQAGGAPRVRFSVDLSYVLSGTPGMEDFMVFDARANEDIFPAYPFICICAYNAGRGVNALVEDMFTTHPLVFVRGLPLANPYYQPWREISSRAAYLERWKTRYSAAALGGPGD